ncbi:MAG: hypothetical protein NC350_03510 [Corallococcus sp.]|nr:hypothetical protein [Corallococcus sp.]
MNSKVDAYIGFAIKKGSVLFGIDTLELRNKKVFLILYSDSVSENTLKKIDIAGKNRNCQIAKIDKLEDIVKRNCKVLGICDKQLADAIKNNLL